MCPRNTSFACAPVWHRGARRDYRTTNTVSMIAAGHYNTEIIGLHALSQIIQSEFEVEIEFIDVPNKV